MAAPETAAPGPLSRFAEAVGRSTARGLSAMGFAGALFGQSAYWLVAGRQRRQPVRAAPLAREMMEIGVGALPIVSILAFTIGLMLAIQGIDVLKDLGAEYQVTLGVALSVTREFAPLITGILVAGRSGSALAARIGTMTISNEVDALRVMGINPVRFLVVPPLVAMLVVVPALALWADAVALFGAGLYITAELGITMNAYVDQTLQFVSVDDLLHGLGKAVLFGGLIALVGVVNGAAVKGGAEGVGRVTTSAVVQAILVIIVTDMLFVFAATR